jgi:hypothetical protein
MCIKNVGPSITQMQIAAVLSPTHKKDWLNFNWIPREGPVQLRKICG